MLQRKFKRVRWKVIRSSCGGWQGLVLIGEIPIHTMIRNDKAAARKDARRKAVQLREAGV